MLLLRYGSRFLNLPYKNGGAASCRAAVFVPATAAGAALPALQRGQGRPRRESRQGRLTSPAGFEKKCLPFFAAAEIYAFSVSNHYSKDVKLLIIKKSLHRLSAGCLRGDCRRLRRRAFASRSGGGGWRFRFCGSADFYSVYQTFGGISINISHSAVAFSRRVGFFQEKIGSVPQSEVYFIARGPR